MSRMRLKDGYIMRGSRNSAWIYDGSEAAAAARERARLCCFPGKKARKRKIHTPKGIVLNLELLDIRRSAEK